MNSIDLATNIGCRVQCKFCPQDVGMSNYEEKNSLDKIELNNPVLMSYSVFVEIIKKIPKNVLIRFSAFSEPFLNPECTKMIQYAHENGYRIELFSTLMGMTIDDVELLKNIQFDKFVIHLADYEKYAKISVTQQKELLKKIISVHIQNVSFMTMGTIPDEFKEIIGMDIKPSMMVNWAGHIEFGKKTERISGPILCSMSESRNNIDIPPIILPNGNALLCCKDWSMDYSLGNLLRDDYDELFQSATFNDVLKKMQSENDDILCRNCEFAIPIKQIEQLEQKYAQFGIDPLDKISIKLNDIYQHYLTRNIDPEGMLFFYPRIKSGDMNYVDIENQLKNSPEFLSIPKKFISKKT